MDEFAGNEANFVGRVFSGYRIEERLGEGGRGVVYRAVDLRLRRPAVLKFLLRSGSDALARAQLLHEAQAAAALNHPNICTIYGIGEEQDQVFIAMEFLEGSDVRQLISSGPLRWTQAVSIFQQAGRALEDAHSKGIVHRDIKSSNIFVTRMGVIKLLDFGLARRSDDSNRTLSDDPDRTRTQGLAGTPAYMAPEQLEYGITDAGTDIWSLSVVLYEMLTARLPFHRNGSSLLRSILDDDPTPPSSLSPKLSPQFDAILAKALAKQREHRYAGIGEMISALQRAGESGHSEVTTHLTGRTFLLPDPRVETRTVAVLPFVNLSSDPNDEYICDGLAEELIDGLTQIQRLRVVSRSSSFHFKGVNPDIREVGRTVRASHVVHGSLRRSGERFRLTAQLSDAREGYQLWSQRFDSTVKDLFSIEDELSAAILKNLRLRLAPPTEKGPERNAHAHDLYLRARYHFNRQTADGLRRAIEYLTEAIDSDPGSAAAHIALAECHATLEWYGVESTDEALPLVKASLENGLRLDPSSVPGLCLLATVQATYDWDWQLAERTFRNALAAGAGFPSVRFHYALDYLTPLGRLDQALDSIRTALELDPISAITNTALGGCYYRLRRFEEATASLRRTIEGNPNFGHAHISLGRALLEQGEAESALRHFDEAVRIIGATPSSLAERAYALARVGKSGEAREILAEIKQIASDEFVSPYLFALVSAGFEDHTALSYLEEALALRTRQLIWINVDPRFDFIRQEQRFQKILSALGLPGGN